MNWQIQRMSARLSFKKLDNPDLCSDLQKKLNLKSSQMFEAITQQEIRFFRLREVVIDKQHRVNHLIVVPGQDDASYLIVSRGKEQPVTVTKGLYRQEMGKKSGERLKGVDELDNIINDKYVKKQKEVNVGISVVRDVREEECVYLSYQKETKSWVLCVGEDMVMLIKEEKGDEGKQQGNQKSVSIQTNIQKWLNSLQEQHRVQLLTLLANNTLLGSLEDDEYSFSLLVNNATGQTHNLEQISSLFNKYKIPHIQSQIEEGQTYQSYQDINSILQDTIAGVQNSWDLQHKVVRVTNNRQMVVEFRVKNRQLVLYEEMRESIESKGKYLGEKGHYPKQHYQRVFEVYRSNYQKLKDYKVHQAVRLILYSRQMVVPLEKLLSSQSLKQITKIDYCQFQDSQLNTFFVYLFVFPEGCNRFAIINQIKGKMKEANCSCISVKYQNQQRMEWNEDIIKKFVTGQGVFEESKYSFILMDVNFHVDIPHKLSSFLAKTIPPQHHYRIFHILPHSLDPFDYATQTSSKPVVYPFDLSLLLYSLKSLERRDEQYDKSLTPIENLSKRIHNLSWNFKNFREDIYEGVRSRAIQVEYRAEFKEISQGLRVSLQELLDFSYRQEYEENTNILHYFVEALENLEIKAEPDIQEAAQQIVMYSFRKLPYFNFT